MAFRTARTVARPATIATPDARAGRGSPLKRSLVGAFHKISVKHLDAYFHELQFRFNNRHNKHAFRDVMKRLLSKEVLRYQRLTAQNRLPEERSSEFAGLDRRPPSDLGLAILQRRLRSRKAQ